MKKPLVCMLWCFHPSVIWEYEFPCKYIGWYFGEIVVVFFIIWCLTLPHGKPVVFIWLLCTLFIHIHSLLFIYATHFSLPKYTLSWCRFFSVMTSCWLSFLSVTPVTQWHDTFELFKHCFPLFPFWIFLIFQVFDLLPYGEAVEFIVLTLLFFIFRRMQCK